MFSIFKGTSEQMLELWNGRFKDFVKSHCEDINSGVQEAWLMRDETTGKLMGELHIVWDREDKDEANGIDTAYIMAFRINEEYQGQHLGTKLMNRVLERVKENEFKTATIGADDSDPKLVVMYKNWGFTKEIKSSGFTYMHKGEKVHCTYQLLATEN